MKILMLTPYLPYPLMSGGQTRSFNLIKNLSKKHEITLFSLIKNEREKENIPELLKYCRKVSVFSRSKTPWTLRNILLTGFGLYPFLVIRNLSSEEKEAIKKELTDEKYDLIHAETFYVMPHIPKTQIPVLLVEQTIEYLVYNHFVEKQAPKFLRPLLRVDVLKLKYWETHFWKQAKRVVAMSDSDRREMRKLSSGLSIDIVPNGIDINYFSRKERVKDPIKKVLYVGNFTWLQNTEAVKILVNSVWPKIKKSVDGVVLWIVGTHMNDEVRRLASDDIKVTEGLEDIRDAYKNASVLVAPIKGPGGTRLKILEAMASALPVVTTSVGAEGLGVSDNNEALIRDDMESLAGAAVDILKDSSLAGRLGKSGKDFVEKNYTWDESSDKLDKIYKEVYGKKP
jgi:glycosyltransferase involved in cell wall biosynthesis